MSRVSRFLHDSMWALPVGCAAALLWANTLPESYFRLAHLLAFTVNEIGLAFFLGFVMKEVVEATLPGGPLHTWRRAALPLASAAGGVVVPITAFLLFLRSSGEAMLTPAWVVTCAVDIAGCYTVGRLIFKRHAAVAFLILMAIAINVMGFTALAVWNPPGDLRLLPGFGLMALALGLAFGLRRSGVSNFWWYLLGPGALSWCALFVGGLHPALALIPIIPFMPHAPRDYGLFVDAGPQVHDTLTSFERWWQPAVQVILLMFGLVNAGVQLHGLENGIWAVPVALIIGRPIGVLVAARLGVTMGLHLPPHLRWSDMAVIAAISSIGLVVALFFAAAAMPGTGPLQDELKTGALLTGIGAVVAFIMARFLGVGRFAR